MDHLFFNIIHNSYLWKVIKNQTREIHVYLSRPKIYQPRNYYDGTTEWYLANGYYKMVEEKIKNGDLPPLSTMKEIQSLFEYMPNYDFFMKLYIPSKQVIDSFVYKAPFYIERLCAGRRCQDEQDIIAIIKHITKERRLLCYNRFTKDGGGLVLDVNEPEPWMVSSSCLGVSIYGNRVQLVKLLLEEIGFCKVDSYQDLWRWINNDNLEMFQLLMSRYPIKGDELYQISIRFIEKKFFKLFSQLIQPLYNVKVDRMTLKSVSSVGNLLLLKELERNFKFRCDGPCISSAASNGHLNIVKYLLHSNNCRTIYSADIQCSMELASANNHMEIVKYIYSLFPTRSFGPNPIDFAIANNHYDMVHYFLFEKSIDTFSNFSLDTGGINNIKMLKLLYKKESSFTKLPSLKGITEMISNGRLEELKFIHGLDNKVIKEVFRHSGRNVNWMNGISFEMAKFYFQDLQLDHESIVDHNDLLNCVAKGSFELIEFLVSLSSPPKESLYLDIFCVAASKGLIDILIKLPSLFNDEPFPKSLNSSSLLAREPPLYINIIDNGSLNICKYLFDTLNIPIDKLECIKQSKELNQYHLIKYFENK
ncbi:hypothetical protein DFA_00847 [Cavenderia fasciculata]|uniref:Ankyrin repeat-containing protein n=1 Tax=Cavenderia fasciculata TaxID=261658 RepID=F4PU52_CACFS|nr:uncharacterized protein DFA_00847 [Cavenderia fasciculata]EGG20978.1 hypothetical protein DFA_00847 [Cavenderia fasciculata]|eukprot:XP_004358828.1 hypothetical protein DFA_00847 [Cavenderia fasciculata]